MVRLALILSLLSALLLGCERPPDSAAAQPPVAIESGDECHLCGMLVAEQAGPKGELYLRDATQALKFCSTRDMFAFLLQPEHRDRIGQAYVHDLAAASWERPDDATFVPAREAWYVVGHALQGAMGHTLASFRERQAADEFAARHGGRVLGFDGITLDVLREITAGDAAHAGQ